MQDHWEKEFPIVEEEWMAQFAECNGEKNRVHFDGEEARRRGLCGIVASDCMINGFVLSAIAQELPEAIPCRMQLKSVKPMYAGSRPSVECKIIDQNGCVTKVAVVIRNGYQTLTEGSCVVILPL